RIIDADTKDVRITLRFRQDAPPPALGMIQSEQKQFSLQLESNDGNLALQSQDGTVQVPAGKYYLTSCRYQCRGQDGKHWQVSAMAGTEVSIAGNQVTRLPLGPRGAAKLSVTQAKGQLDLNLMLSGAGGEEIHDVRVEGTREQPPVPKVKL